MAAWLRQLSLADAWYNTCFRLLRTKPVGSMAHGSDDLTELVEGSAVGLAKVLTTVDLVSLGVGSCVGTGMYVVAGLVAKAMAGPGVILSFIIAAVASILSGETTGRHMAPSVPLLCPVLQTVSLPVLFQVWHFRISLLKACVTQSLASACPRRLAQPTPTAT